MTARPVSAEDVGRWKALAEKASHAPWPESWDYKRISDDSEFVIAQGVGPQIISRGVQVGDSRFLQPSEGASAQMQADAAFISTAREAIPALIEALARSEERITEARKLMQDVCDAYPVSSGQIEIDGQKGYGTIKALSVFLASGEAQ